MRRLAGILIAAAALAAASLLWLTRGEVIAAASLPAYAPDAAAGARIYAAGGCNSCHAAPGAKGEALDVLSGGLALKSPFGTFLAPNISPDPQAGIGGWSMDQFVTAMVKGTGPDGRHYYPAFPYPSYARMTLTDVMDLKAYLDTLPPSAEPSQPHRIGFPFNVRQGLGLWKWLYLDPAPVLAAGDDLLARGRYLVEGPGHCAECHTPRNQIGGLRRDAWLAGAPNPEGKGKIPNITPHEGGLGAWSAEDIAYYLETGFTPEYDSAGGAMVSVIGNISRLPAEDRAAIAAYLKSVPARATE